jgi:hypothetical protein
MRKLAFGIAAVLAGMLLSEPSMAAKRSYNYCYQLALNRGWSPSDFYAPSTRAELRQFIRRCQQGRQN